jgi:hypothetical protein
MEMTEQNTIGINKRSGKDRRDKSGFNIRSFLFGGRREKIRRREDTRRILSVNVQKYSSSNNKDKHPVSAISYGWILFGSRFSGTLSGF